MINIAICDDNPTIIEDVKKALLEYEKKTSLSCTVTEFPKPLELYAYMQTEKIDIVFMDLVFETPEDDGITWSARIHNQFPNCLLLILTAYEDRYKEGYIARAFRFMTKPLIYQEFEQNMNACLNELQLNQNIIVMHHGSELTIPLKNLIYLTAHFGGTEICTTTNTFYSNDSMLQWEQRLEGNAFLRIHKKYIINLAHIHSLENHIVCMSNGKQLAVSRRKWSILQSSHVKYDLKKGLSH